MKKIFSILLVAALLITGTIGATGMSVSAAEEDKNITSQHELKVGDEIITLDVSLINGSYVITTDYAFDGPNVEKVVKAINQYIQELTASEENSTKGWFIGWDQFESGANNIDLDGVSVVGYMTVLFNHPDLTHVDATADGSIGGYWTGGGAATYILLGQSLTMSGASISVAWPDTQFQISTSGYTVTYTSTPFYDTNFASSTYSHFYGISSVAIYSYAQTDSVTARVNNVDHRTSSYMYVSWQNFSHVESPTGYCNHTSG
ncbi:MAG: hypothetical protein ACOWWR_17550 [Eubacteriales bacterium]